MINKKRGFTLLLAALIASIVLSFATAIFSIAQKQVVLASLSQQSQYAFYAADTAAECGLYWDIRFGYFSTTTAVAAVTPECDGAPLSVAPAPPYAAPDYTVQITKLPLQNNLYCANVSVHKCLGTITTGGTCCPSEGITNGSCDAMKAVTTVSTQIKADGFNASCTNIDSNTAILERTVTLNY
jgi:type II secretory pathway pseudopilin PulG